MSMLKKLAKVVSGALAVGAMFYLAGGAADGIVPGVNAIVMGAFGFLVGLAYGMSSAIE